MTKLPSTVLPTTAAPDEEPFERSLRPQTLDEFIGQDRLKKNLRVFIEAARQRKEPLDHCLFYSPPGLGKTTLAGIIAHEMQVGLRITSGPVLERKGDLAAILTSLSPHDVFFIDEIHRLNHVVEETLYSVMEDFKLDIIIGEGPSAKTINLPIQPFTLVGATTRAGLLTSPLRDRFGITAHLEFYSEAELVHILQRSSRILKIGVEEGGFHEIGRRSRGTPRIANRLLRRLRDFADVSEDGRLTAAVAQNGLSALDVDDRGLDTMDRRLLSALIEKFKGGPVGVETLAVALSEDVDTLTDVYEPFLIQCGFLARTPRGRVATEHAYRHLNIPPPAQESLF
ncbi:MAG: Holliday junction DNA helicase RuvB [Elusimicrobia bacterium RIFCSPLOWO2_01_FULL_59_12]|nr:MAG: Holliday junction DNA helicase RuvB [Elusimicrobia bacterium RIFCSPLOWO2_01_FULL_59_12]